MAKRRSTRKSGKGSASTKSTTNASSSRTSPRAKAQGKPTPQVFDTLHKEMEVVGYGKKNGQYKRKLPRKQKTARLQKRRLLAKEDDDELAILAEEKHDENNNIRRLRGSKAAIEDHVIEGSAIFPQQENKRGKKKPTKRGEHQQPDRNEKDQPDLDVTNVDGESTIEEGGAKSSNRLGGRNVAFRIEAETEAGVASDGDEAAKTVGHEPDDEEDQRSENDDDEGEEQEVEHESTETTPKGSKRRSNRKGINNSRIAKSRRMYKMRNFQSFKLAQQHGDALGAHARGKRKEAIAKLKQVARDAPSAPQVYSALGMVYEDWLQETRRQQQDQDISRPTEAVGPSQRTALTTDTDTGDKAIDNKLEELNPILAKQLKLAEKAYGSYHVAAILCKKDFTLWVRAADSASEIADLHAKAISMPQVSVSEQVRHNYRSERKRWLSEAKRDYTMADNLKPPGIDVPAKLAAVHMELGNLSEALTLLTDLKNRGSSRAGKGGEGGNNSVDRSEFESSYRAWWLYADLMLRIGHECTQWNRGVRTNDNYMFRRWLRKLSKEFDWQERRLQALSLALEAAAGSQSAERYVAWVRQRAHKLASSSDKDRWHLDTDGATEVNNTGKNSDNNNEKPDGNVMNDQENHDKAVKEKASIIMENVSPEEAGLSSDWDEEPSVLQPQPTIPPVRRRGKRNVQIQQMPPLSSPLQFPPNQDDQQDQNAIQAPAPVRSERYTRVTHIETADEAKNNWASLLDFEQSPLDISIPEGDYEEPLLEVPNDDPRDLGLISPDTPELLPNQASQSEKDRAVPGSTEDGENEAERTGSPTKNPVAKVPRASDEPGASQFDKEKALLTEKNAEELHAFDRTTTELGLEPGSLVAKNREEARQKLLFRHNDEIRTLANEYDQTLSPSKTAHPNNDADGEDEVIGLGRTPLPISGSCRTVCRIASELMKHMYGLSLFEGGALVGEVVSRYFKERAKVEDKKIAARKRSIEWQKNAETSLLFNFETPYDQIREGLESSDEDEADIYLSDDEDLEGNNELLDSLRTGALPPEIRVLFALSLIVNGNRDFAAKKCIEAIDDLEQESRTWLSDPSVEDGFEEDVLWSLFKRAMTEALGRTSAYAFLADVLQKTGMEAKWAAHLHPLYHRHLQTLKSVGLRDELLRMSGEMVPSVNFRKNQIVKTILAATRLELHKIGLLVPDGLSSELPRRKDDDENNDVELALDALGSLTDILHLVWKVGADGSLSMVCKEVVQVFGRTLAWLTREECGTERLHKIFEYVRRIISFLCGTSIPEISDVSEVSNLKDVKWPKFPVHTSWQLTQYKPISLRIYNLCVASNVTLFSGWEPDEFNLRLLRRRHGDKHFGIHIDAGRVAGHLNSLVEQEINRQWDKLGGLLQSFPELEYSRRLSQVKETAWYKNEALERSNSIPSDPISKFGEDDGILIFLSFSSTCLRLAANNSKDENSWNALVQAALSVLLPISQFSLDSLLWDSEIGEAASTLTGFDDWKLLSTAHDDGKPTAKPTKPVTPRKRKTPKVVEKKVKQWVEKAEKRSLDDFVTISTREMQELWNALSNAEPGDSSNSADGATTLMQKVHQTSQKLRSCYTAMAAEKTALQLAVALLDMASHPSCHNPFMCLQQAAVFASHGSKVGNNDMLFRHSVPKQESCTPREALVILGRADCLQSMYFPNEAAFLCSYVARVCSLHRDRERSDLEWNDHWKIVAVYAYNVSVMIRATVESVLDENMKVSFLKVWEREVIEELERAKLDAQAWKRSVRSKKNDDNQQGNNKDGATQEENGGDDEEQSKSGVNSDIEHDEDVDGDGSDDDADSIHKDNDGCDDEKAKDSNKAVVELEITELVAATNTDGLDDVVVVGV